MCFHCSLQVYRLCGLIIVIGAMAVIAESSLGMTKLAGRCRGRQVAQNYIVPVSLARNNDIVWDQPLGLCSESVPMGKTLTYGLRFALRNAFTTQPCGLTRIVYHCYSCSSQL